MPLPKSCSVAARATEAYAEAWSVVLYECWGVKPPRDEPLPPLIQLLPFVRQLLTCCACAGLLEDAMISLSCGHCYCAKCQHGTPLLKIQCRQCKERMGLVSEDQIQLLVQCYRHMCHVLSEYLVSNPTTAVHKGEFVLAKGKEIPEGFNPITEIIAEVVEGVKVSRTVLFVMPPQKYLNPKPLPDPPTPKKEQISPKAASPTLSPVHESNASVEESVTPQTPPPEEDEMSLDVTETPQSLSLPAPGSPCVPDSTPSTSTQLVKENQTTKEDSGTVDKGEKVEKKVGKVTLCVNKSFTLPKKATKKSKLVNIPSAWFHGNVDYPYSRPASRRGVMKLFWSLKLLRLKTATLPSLETCSEVMVDCLDQDLICPIRFVYKIRQDVLSNYLLPEVQRMHCSCLPTFQQILKPKPEIKPACGKRNSRAVFIHPRNPLLPRSKYRLLRRKYKSIYLSSPQCTQQQKPKITKAPKITITLSKNPTNLPSSNVGASTFEAGASSAMKKKKRSPMTPGHWRCRCGTNNPQSFDRICARGKCPCFVKNIACDNCLCRHCKNPFNVTYCV